MSQDEPQNLEVTNEPDTNPEGEQTNEATNEEEEKKEIDTPNQEEEESKETQAPANRIAISQPEEVFSRVPHGRSKGSTKNNFRKTQPLPINHSTSRDSISNDTNANQNNTIPNRVQTGRSNNNRFSQTSKSPRQYQMKNRVPNPNAYRPTDANNRKRFSQTCPLNRPQSSRTTSTDNLLTQTQQRTYTMTPELENLKKQAIDQEPLEVDDNSVLEDLLLLLSEERRQLASEHDFKESQRRNEAIGYVMECQNWLLKIEAQKAQLDDVQQRQEALDEQIENFDIETREIRHKTKKKQRRKREKLLKEQSQEVQALKEQWTDDEKLHLYNKSSNTLICLRRQLALLLQQCRFEDAEQVQAQIDERQKLEEKQNHDLMQRDFNEVFNKMKSRQIDDLAYFDQNAEMEMKKLNRRREKLRQALVNRERKIQDKSDTAMNPDKLWNSMKVNRGDQGKKQNQALMMPTLKVSKNDLKNEKIVQNLTLPPLTMPEYDPKSQSKAAAAKKEDDAKKKKTTAGKRK